MVVTHQSGVGRGYFDQAAIAELHARFLEEFARRGAPLDAIYSCPHAPEAPPGPSCLCAKPLPELGFRAAAELGLDLAGSFMIGDKVDDVLFGLNIGAASILVLTGYGRAASAALAVRGIRPAYAAAGVLDAAAWILERGKGPAYGPL